MRRKITVELTDKQYEALAGAVTTEENYLQDLDGSQPRIDTLNRAWAKIHAAWWEKAKS